VYVDLLSIVESVAFFCSLSSPVSIAQHHCHVSILGPTAAVALIEQKVSAIRAASGEEYQSGLLLESVVPVDGFDYFGRTRRVVELREK
jgi:hypothetical protein